MNGSIIWWLDIGQKVVPWVALLVAIASFRISSSSLRITENQARERSSNIDFGLNDLWYVRKNDGGRTFALDVTVINKASVANSIVRLELIVTYSLATGHEVRLRLPISTGEDLDLPIRLDSFQSTTKTFKFDLSANTIPVGAKIESHSFEFTETSGETHEIAPTLIIEKQSF
jgi:hypothetical protein